MIEQLSSEGLRARKDSTCNCAHAISSHLNDKTSASSSARAPSHPYTNGLYHADGAPISDIIEDPFEDKLEPIAVIGLAMRGPQDATSPEALWKMIREGRSAMTEIPGDRFNPDAFCKTENPRIGSLNVRGGHFMKEDLAAFDAPFFSISSAEAALMDPQQRWLLETSYEALESAGIPIHRATGTRTSVHIGSFTREFEIMLLRDPEMRAKYRATGTGMTMLANRLSWYYDFSGPSLTVDTACSSSLTTVHLACQGLRSGEVDMGIAGGCNVILNPDTMTALTDMSFLSPDNKCHSFDASANGYSRGEGFGLVILKRLKDALRDRDTIRGVIRGTGVGQDGRTPSITQPNSAAQERLIKDTYREAGLSLGLTRFFEAHGTGTPVGDPLEAQAIYRSFQEPLKHHPMYIGAVKSNTGHLEGASGVTGLIKTIMSLEEGIIPPNLWFKEINPRIQAKAWNLEFPTTNIPWPTSGLRRASVNSFGYGGSNAHCIIDDAYNYLRLRGLDGNHATQPLPSARDLPLSAENDRQDPNGLGMIPDDQPTHSSLLVWSAPDEVGLNRLTATYRYALPQITNTLQSSDKSLAYTLSERRTSFPWKSFMVSTGFDTLLNTTSTMLSKPVRSLKDPSLCYVFTGQGAQWAKMGSELEVYTTYAQSLHAADIYFQSLGSSWSLRAELEQDSCVSCLDEASLSQPACTALQIALVDLLTHWGIQPTVVIGHSSGEIAAAYCAGAISRESAWKIAYFRGLVASRMGTVSKTQQGMMAVALSEAEAGQYIQKFNLESCHLTVACVNSPRSVTISGDIPALDSLKSELMVQGVFARKLRVNVAYHSNLMLSVVETYTSLLGEISSAQPSALARPVMISSVTGSKIETSKLCSASYWVQNLVSTVRFSDAVAVVCNSSKTPSRKLQRTTSTTAIDHFVEIGPHSTLRGALRETHQTSSTQRLFGYSSILNRGESSSFSAVRAAGEIFCVGVPISVSKVNLIDRCTKVRVLVNLPQYPFDHSKRYWQESRISKEFRFRTQPHHELLGSPAMDWNPLQACWRNHLSVSEAPWLADHKVQGSVLYPAAGVIAMAMEAARRLMGSGRAISAYRFKKVMLSKALIIPPDPATVETQFHLVPLQGDATDSILWGKFTLFAFEESQPVEISSGNVGLDFETVSQNSWDSIPVERHLKSIHNRVEAGLRRCTSLGSPDVFYKSLDDTGVTYGPSFQCINDLSIGPVDRTATATVDLFNWRSRTTADVGDNTIIHPIALDAVFQLISAAASQGGTKPGPPMVPTKIRDLWISTTVRASADHPNATVFASVDHQGLRSTELSLAATDTDSGNPIITGTLQTSFLSSSSEDSGPQGRFESPRLCYKIEWKPEVDFLSGPAFRSITSGSEYRMLDAGAGLEAIERLCAILCNRIRDFSGNPEVLATKPHLVKYLQWAEHSASLYAARTDIDHGYNQAEIDRMISDVEGTGLVGRLMARVARALPDILNGTVDALELLFQDSLIQEFYANANNAAELFSETARYIDLLAHRNPALRILEIGAGTGSATASALSVVSQDEAAGQFVSRFSEWNYTDVSSGFFEQAREKFQSQAARMKFTVLDIEKDPIEQGLQSDYYDLIIAANVIHATQDLNQTLRNARKLLKPNGTFLMYEMTKPDRLTTGFIFGLLPGWWAASEETRKWSPLITENEWHQQLIAAGFSGITHSLPNSDNADAHTTTAMFSKAIPSTSGSTVDTIVTVVVRAGSELQIEIAKELTTALNSVGLASTEIVTLPELSRALEDNLNVVFLADLEDSFLLTMDEVELTSLQYMVSHSKIIVWPTCERFDECVNSASSMVEGFLRVIRLEQDRLTAILVSLEDKCLRKPKIAHIVQVFSDALDKAPTQVEVEYEERDGIIGTRRLVEHRIVNNTVTGKLSPQQPQLGLFDDGANRPLKLTTGVTGLLNTLHFEEDKIAHSPVGADEIEVRVMCSGLNFRDVLIALGQLNGNGFGSECSGIVVQNGINARFHPGDRVACIASGSIGSYARCNALTAVKLPPSVSFHAAAALPIIFCTAYYALVDIANLQEKESVLIHSATGGLGQALVQLALMLGAEIYATVGTEAKKNLLVQKYGLRPDHVFSSRNSAFVQGIELATSGRGVDVVVNSLSGERLKNSWECTAPFGRFVEVGKRDVENFQSLPMSKFSLNTSFSSVDLLFVKEHKPVLAGKLLETVFSLFMQGKIQLPADLRVYNATRVEEAFRFMQSGKATGKAIFEFSPTDKAQIIPSLEPNYTFDSRASYVIAGGLGGLGRSAAKWLVDRGARYLILLSRSKPTAYSPAVEAFIKDLKACGVHIYAPPCDVADLKALQDCLAVCASTMPPIKGCIQASMVLKDGRFGKLALSEFQAAVTPKVQGSWNLHAVLPSDLDFFIMLSSGVGLLGNYGQSNYASGGTYQDSLAHYRIFQGQKAISLDLGVVNSVGYVAEQLKPTGSSDMITDSTGVTEAQFLAVLDYYCDPSLPVLSHEEAQVAVGLDTPVELRARGNDDPFWLRKPIASYLHRIEQKSDSTDPTVTTMANNVASLPKAQSIADASDIVCEALTSKLSRFVDIKAENIEVTKPLHVYGIDSLSAVELRKWFARVLKADVTVFDILGNSTIESLSRSVAEKSALVSAKA